MDAFAIAVSTSAIETIHGVSTFATVAASSDREVELWFTMGGILPFLEDRVADPALADGPIGEAVLEADNAPLYTEQLKWAKEHGDIRITLCGMAMDLIDTTLDDYVDIVDDQMGIGGFWRRAVDMRVIYM
jgi:peroxiredoxin family protein